MHPDEMAALHTATAIAAAARRDDPAAVVELWNATAGEDPAATMRLVKAMADLPTIMAQQLAHDAGKVLDIDQYYLDTLRNFARETGDE